VVCAGQIVFVLLAAIPGYILDHRIMLNPKREKSRRRFLGALGASAAWSGLPAGSPAQSRSPEPLPSDDRKLKINSVKAYPVAIGGSFRGATPKFSSDFDSACLAVPPPLILGAQTRKGGQKWLFLISRV
jgi:hypothetical protein